jgi:hypothetical protein
MQVSNFFLICERSADKFGEKGRKDTEKVRIAYSPHFAAPSSPGLTAYWFAKVNSVSGL